MTDPRQGACSKMIRILTSRWCKADLAVTVVCDWISKLTPLDKLTRRIRCYLAGEA